MRVIFFIATAWFYSSIACAASFDCAEADTPVETMICNDEGLNYLDEALSHNYLEMLAAFKSNPKAIKSIKDEQRDWITSRNGCSNVQCIQAAYLRRLDETCDYDVSAGVRSECTMSNEARRKLEGLKSKGN